MKKQLKILLTALIVIFILLGFAVPVNMVGNWYQQFLPNLNGATIKDITFTDSLNGYAATSLRSLNDSAYILKTTNSGDTWNIEFVHNRAFVRIEFINANTGFTNAFTKIFKTTDAGTSWNPINLPSIFGDDMFVLSQDTIWLAMSEGLTGGAFLTTNGGVDWTRKFYDMNNNPTRIYMYNARIGFISTNSNTVLRRTSDGGASWNIISGENGFSDIKFADSLTGWKAFGLMKKTTDGGLNWVQQAMPSGGIILSSSAAKLSVLNRDTIWAVGGEVFYGSGQFRGIIFRTINGGQNWQFQVPDTAIHLNAYPYIQFINRNTGWVYRYEGGIHTTTGGDPVWITGIKQISNEIPKEFKLYQNYPNPFNPATVISYQLTFNSFVNLKVFDLSGKQIIVLVNQKQTAGTYEVDFNGSAYSSGVYFYKIIVFIKNEVYSETKKLILLK